MNKREYKEFEKKYDKFKKNNLPRDFFDDERQTLEYVYYVDELDSINKAFMQENEDFDRRLHVEKRLVDALGDIACTGFCYPYTCKYFTLPKKDDEKEKRDYVIKLGHTHAHDFDHVVSSLYDFPESFKIEDDELEYYSKQELEYLRRVQKYLLFIGMRDLEKSKPSVTRYRNKLQKKYGKAFIHSFKDESLNDFLSGKRDFVVRVWYDSFTPSVYDEDEVCLFTDLEDNFKMYIRYTFSEEKTYKEIKDIFKDERFKDNDKVILRHFEILEKF